MFQEFLGKVSWQTVIVAVAVMFLALMFLGRR